MKSSMLELGRCVVFCACVSDACSSISEMEVIGPLARSMLMNPIQ